jgi:hypothetical protein
MGEGGRGGKKAPGGGGGILPGENGWKNPGVDSRLVTVTH